MNNLRNTMFILNNTEEISEVINALDFYSRIWIGQYLEIDNQMIWLKQELHKENSVTKVTPQLLEIRNRLLPNLATGIANTLQASYGIYSDQIDKRARIAYDMQQVIRYTAAWYLHPDGGMGVDFGRPLPAEDTIPFITATCFSHNNGTEMRINLSDPLQWQILQDAVAVLNCLYHGKIHDLFAYYTNDKVALEIAKDVEKYYAGIANIEKLPEILVHFPE